MLFSRTKENLPGNSKGPRNMIAFPRPYQVYHQVL